MIAFLTRCSMATGFASVALAAVAAAATGPAELARSNVNQLRGFVPQVSTDWFRAYLRGFEPADWERMEKLQEGRKFFLSRLIDIPAIAKANREFTKYLVVYSPEGREAFTNLNTPCFHGNTDLDVINPGETKWTRTYYTFFEGNLESYFRELKKLHQAVDVNRPQR